MQEIIKTSNFKKQAGGIGDRAKALLLAAKYIAPFALGGTAVGGAAYVFSDKSKLSKKDKKNKLLKNLASGALGGASLGVGLQGLGAHLSEDPISLPSRLLLPGAGALAGASHYFAVKDPMAPKDEQKKQLLRSLLLGTTAGSGTELAIGGADRFSRGLLG